MRSMIICEYVEDCFRKCFAEWAFVCVGVACLVSVDFKKVHVSVQLASPGFEEKSIFGVAPIFEISEAGDIGFFFSP